jgi:hypothetical protein
LTFNYPNVAALAKFLESQLIIKTAEPAAAALVSAIALPGREAGLHILSDDELDALSDDELEARLMARLEHAR